MRIKQSILKTIALVSLIVLAITLKANYDYQAVNKAQALEIKELQTQVKALEEKLKIEMAKPAKTITKTKTKKVYVPQYKYITNTVKVKDTSYINKVDACLTSDADSDAQLNCVVETTMGAME